MPFEKFLLPKESIEYASPERVEYEGSFHNLYITNMRLIFHSRKGLLFKKERVVSERLLEIQSMSCKDTDTMKGRILKVKSLHKKMDIVGSRDNIKMILRELRKQKKSAEENAGAKLYLDQWLVQNHNLPLAQNLATIVWKKANRCCMCDSKKVSFCILNVAGLAHSFVMFARLFCRKHEGDWKKFEISSYEKLNGVMLVEKQRHKPVGIWANMSWKEFQSLLEKYTKDDRYEARFVPAKTSVSLMDMRSDLIFKGRIDEFLEVNK